MATALLIDHSLLGLQVSGDAFGLTFYTKARHRVVAYAQAPPKLPRTFGQKAWATRFGNAMRAWRALSEPDRQLYRDYAKASGIPMLGHNIWVSLCLRPTLSLWTTLCHQSHLSLHIPVLC